MTAIVDTEQAIQVNGDKSSNSHDIIDLEKNALPQNSQTQEQKPIPTRMDIFYDLNGSLGFAVGSSGFILEKYFTNWLPYFRYGSIAWIWGCVFYSIPLLIKLKVGFRSTDGQQCRSPWGIGDLGEFLCYLFYFIGCVFGGFFDLESVEKFLPAINHTFVYGSFSLALEPLYQVYLFIVRSGSFASRVRATKLFGTPSNITSKDTVDNNSTSSDSNDEEGEPSESVSLPPLKLHWDRFFELNAMVFFCLAGLFGGFPPHPTLMLPGVYFWEVGSLFSVARSVLMIHKRNQRLAALRN